MTDIPQVGAEEWYNGENGREGERDGRRAGEGESFVEEDQGSSMEREEKEEGKEVVEILMFPSARARNMIECSCEMVERVKGIFD